MKSIQVKQWETHKEKPQSGVGMLVSKNLEFWINNMINYKGEYSITMKGSIIQET